MRKNEKEIERKEEVEDSPWTLLIVRHEKKIKQEENTKAVIVKANKRKEMRNET